MQEEVYSMLAADYELGVPIGYGSSAIVCIARYRPTGRQVAIKIIDLDMFERNQIDELRREIQIMALSKHPNLLPVHGSFVNGSKLYIVTPFLSAGSCLDIMKTAYPSGLDESSISTILRQALQGLEYLHKNGRIHRDVKAGNLLMDEDGTVQLADFGVSSSLMDTGERRGVRKTFVGTPCWMAPEVMDQSGYDYKADIWSFGITSLELATGHAPYAKYPPLKVLMLTLHNDPPTLDRDQTAHKYSKTFKDMIDTCLQKDPSKRPTAEKLLQHSFFKQSTKKRQHLVADLLHGLPPLTQRQHNKKSFPPERDDSKGILWDFDGEKEAAPVPAESDKPPDSVGSNLELNARPSVSFSLPKKEKSIPPSNLGPGAASSSSSSLSSQSEQGTEREDGQLQASSIVEIRKGRFSVSEGQRGQQQSPSQESPNLTLSPSMEGERRSTGRFAVLHNAPNQAPQPQQSTPAPLAVEAKQSRFTVKATTDGGSQSSSPATSIANGVVNQTQPAPQQQSQQQQQPGQSQPQQQQPPQPQQQPQPKMSTGPASANDKRGRFEVSSVDQSATASATDSSASPNSSPSNSLGRGSRFTTTLVTTVSNQLASSNAPTSAGSQHQTMGQLSQRPAFQNAASQQQQHAQTGQPTPTPGQSQTVAPAAGAQPQQSSQPPQAPAPPAYDDRLDTILRQNEQLKTMLNDLLVGITTPSTATLTGGSARGLSIHAGSAMGNLLAASIQPQLHQQQGQQGQFDYGGDAQGQGMQGQGQGGYDIPAAEIQTPYDAQILAILQENEMLRQENDALRNSLAMMERQLNQLGGQQQ
ncbi:hypothetical protein HK101_004293 [Irineochytrium annulatum]|nr:hypothetical protein HK101_004293 [Irineochytrium annulatum]